MRNIVLITLTFLILNFVGLSDVKIFSTAENFADARSLIRQSGVAVSENFAEEVLQLVNIEREKVGLKPLKLSPQLMQSANIRAKELPTLFSHTRPDGTDCFTAVKIPYRRIGENVAAGQPTPKDVVEAWMDSPGHRENILNPNFGRMGIGYVNTPNTDYRHYWAQLFMN